MHLEPKENARFFKLWLGLCVFYNNKHKVTKSLIARTGDRIDTDAVATVAHELWDHMDIIDEFIDAKNDLSGTDIKILRKWKSKYVRGPFAVLRHTKHYSVFLDNNESTLYGVIGISDPISSQVPENLLPLVLDTILLPYGNRIIYDGIVHIYPEHLPSPGLKNKLEGLYTKIIEEKGIVTFL